MKNMEIESLVCVKLALKANYLIVKEKIKKRAVSTRTSQGVPHLSTNHALNRLTSEFEWDPVL